MGLLVEIFKLKAQVKYLVAERDLLKRAVIMLAKNAPICPCAFTECDRPGDHDSIERCVDCKVNVIMEKLKEPS